MATMTQPIESSSHRRHWMVTALFVAGFWIAGVAAVIGAHAGLDPRSRMAGAAAALAAIVAIAYGYMRLAAPDRSVTHALSVGTSWLVLSMAAEITMASRLGHGWFTLIGSPDHPLLRNVYLFVWIFAPALFARGLDDMEAGD